MSQIDQHTALETEVESPAIAPVSKPTPAPISGAERIQSIDTLRGVAVLGILPMNVLTGFALVSAAFMNPKVAGGFEGANFWVWVVTHLTLDMKMMTIFSMLFGAGMIVITGRAESRGASPAGLFYKRTGWLVLIGFLHAYLLWFGDILFAYALCGMILYLMRKWSPGVLIIVGMALISVGAILFFGLGLMFHLMRESGSEQWDSMWASISADFDPTPEQIAAETAARGGSVTGLLLWNAKHVFIMHFFMMPFFGTWRILGAMMLGVALMKMGVFTAQRSFRFYAGMMALGYPIGFAFIIPGMLGGLSSGFDVVYVHMWGFNANYFGSLFVALGHVGLIMVICKAGLFAGAQHVLAQVGRMALTNYLTQTLICMFIFSAWGLGMFQRFDRVELILIVLGIWTVQLIWSPLWLAKYRFGPAEWVWRGLTYGQKQPMRRVQA